MEHRINVKIGDRSYPKYIESEDEEEAIRKAAVTVNSKISALSQIYNNVSMLDIVTIAAINEGIEKFELEKRLEDLQRQYAKISADLAQYVGSLK